MLKQSITLLIASSLLACAGPQTDQNRADGGAEAPRRDCIFRASIRGYTVLNESNLLVETGPKRSYHLVLRRPARGLRSSWSIGFKSTTGSICAGFSEVVFDGRLDNESIRIASIRRLSTEEREDIEIQFGLRAPEVETAPPPAEVEGAEVEELDTDANGD